MSPEDDQHPQHSSARLANIDVEMPAVSRGWNPISQSDDLQQTTIATSNANNAATTPKKPITANGNGLLPSSTTVSENNSNGSPTNNATLIIPNGNGNASHQNGGHPNGNGSALAATTTKNGTASTATTSPSSPSSTLNGNGAHYHNGRPQANSKSNSTTATPAESNNKTANNNDVWSPAPQSSAQSATTSPARIEKNGWKELPQDEQDEHPVSNGNGNIGGTGGADGPPSSNGGAAGTGGNLGNVSPVLGATQSLGLGEKMPPAHEDDPLTGVVVCKDIDPDELSTCGIGACQPKWARMFATTKSFMCVFLIAWVLQGMYFTYVVSVITTIEKLFQIKSKTSGMLLSATEVGQIGTALLLTYFAGQGHRPRWIACGMVLFAVSAFGCSIPHFMYGSELLHANNALYGRGQLSTAGGGGGDQRGPYSDALRVQTTGGGSGGSSAVDDLADRVLPMLAARAAENSTQSMRSRSSSGGIEYNLCRANGNGTSSFDGACKTEQLEEQAQHSQITYTVLVMLVICMLGVGIGQTAVATLGIPFIDDNVASRESAIYIAITIGVRILGPTSGFMLGSICTRLHVDLLDPGYGPDDPKWVGAWYLGLVIIPTLMFVAALAMFTFPKHLRGHRIPPPIKLRAIESAKKLEKRDEDVARPRLRDFPKTIRRQLSNDILMFRTASSVLHLLPVAGLYTFLPKYLESQFQLAAHESSMITGTYGILVMGVGIVISGVVILKCSPTARSVAAYIAFTAIVYSAGMATLMFLGCSMDDFVGLRAGPTASATAMPATASAELLFAETRFVPPCNATCDCDYGAFAPICGSDGKTYFSSCHAGCSIASVVNGKTHYRDCVCIPENLDAQFEAITGHCDSSCKSYIAFIALFSFLVFMHSTSEVGSMLLIMRCTDPKDKAMAMGIIQFAIGLFGNVPCPIIYGAVIDSTCLVWDTICGKQGACKQYDKDAFRHFFFGTTSGIMFLAFIMDLVVWHKAHRIDIDPENNASSASSAASDADAEKQQQPQLLQQTRHVSSSSSSHGPALISTTPASTATTPLTGTTATPTTTIVPDSAV